MKTFNRDTLPPAFRERANQLASLASTAESEGYSPDTFRSVYADEVNPLEYVRPDLLKTMGAAARQAWTPMAPIWGHLVSTLNEPESDMGPDWDVTKAWGGTIFETHPELQHIALRARTPYELARLDRETQNEIRDGEILRRSYGAGLPWMLTFGALDPVNILPVGAGLKLSSSVLKGAAITGSSAAAMNMLIEETMYAPAQPQHSPWATAAAGLMGAVFGGAVGGVGQVLSKAKLSRLRAALERNIEFDGEGPILQLGPGDYAVVGPSRQIDTGWVPPLLEAGPIRTYGPEDPIPLPSRWEDSPILMNDTTPALTRELLATEVDRAPEELGEIPPPLGPAPPDDPPPFVRRGPEMRPEELEARGKIAGLRETVETQAREIEQIRTEIARLSAQIGRGEGDLAEARRLRKNLQSKLKRREVKHAPVAEEYAAARKAATEYVIERTTDLRVAEPERPAYTSVRQLRATIERLKGDNELTAKLATDPVALAEKAEGTGMTPAEYLAFRQQNDATRNTRIAQLEQELARPDVQARAKKEEEAGARVQFKDVTGERNVWSGSDDPFLAALTNPTTISKRKKKLTRDYPVTFRGKTYPDAESAYKAHRTGTDDDFSTMVEVLKAKLEQHPELAAELERRGGRAYVETLKHDAGRKDRWGGGIENQRGFISALATAMSEPPPAPKGERQRTPSASPVRILKGVPAVRAAAAKGEGIDTLRQAGDQHFGNPFTHLPTKTRAEVRVGSINEAIASYGRWLRGTAHQEVAPARRAWILQQIDSGALDGKPLLYYTDIPDSHAHELARVIAERRRMAPGPPPGMAPDIAAAWAERQAAGLGHVPVSLDWIVGVRLERQGLGLPDLSAQIPTEKVPLWSLLPDVPGIDAPVTQRILKEAGIENLEQLRNAFLKKQRPKGMKGSTWNTLYRASFSEAELADLASLTIPITGETDARVSAIARTLRRNPGALRPFMQIPADGGLVPHIPDVVDTHIDAVLDQVARQIEDEVSQAAIERAAADRELDEADRQELGNPDPAQEETKRRAVGRARERQTAAEGWHTARKAEAKIFEAERKERDARRARRAAEIEAQSGVVGSRLRDLEPQPTRKQAAARIQAAGEAGVSDQGLRLPAVEGLEENQRAVPAGEHRDLFPEDWKKPEGLRVRLRRLPFLRTYLETGRILRVVRGLVEVELDVPARPPEMLNAERLQYRAHEARRQVRSKLADPELTPERREELQNAEATFTGFLKENAEEIERMRLRARKPVNLDIEGQDKGRPQFDQAQGTAGFLARRRRARLEKQSPGLSSRLLGHLERLREIARRIREEEWLDPAEREMFLSNTAFLQQSGRQMAELAVGDKQRIDKRYSGPYGGSRIVILSPEQLEVVVGPDGAAIRTTTTTPNKLLRDEQGRGQRARGVTDERSATARQPDRTRPDRPEASGLEAKNEPAYAVPVGRETQNVVAGMADEVFTAETSRASEMSFLIKQRDELVDNYRDMLEQYKEIFRTSIEVQHERFIAQKKRRATPEEAKAFAAAAKAEHANLAAARIAAKRSMQKKVNALNRRIRFLADDSAMLPRGGGINPLLTQFDARRMEIDERIAELDPQIERLHATAERFDAWQDEKGRYTSDDPDYNRQLQAVNDRIDELSSEKAALMNEADGLPSGEGPLVERFEPPPRPVQLPDAPEDGLEIVPLVQTPEDRLVELAEAGLKLSPEQRRQEELDIATQWIGEKSVYDLSAKARLLAQQGDIAGALEQVGLDTQMQWVREGRDEQDILRLGREVARKAAEIRRTGAADPHLFGRDLGETLDADRREFVREQGELSEQNFDVQQERLLEDELRSEAKEASEAFDEELDGEMAALREDAELEEALAGGRGNLELSEGREVDPFTARERLGEEAAPEGQREGEPPPDEGEPPTPIPGRPGEPGTPAPRPRAHQIVGGKVVDELATEADPDFRVKEPDPPRYRKDYTGPETASELLTRLERERAVREAEQELRDAAQAAKEGGKPAPQASRAQARARTARRQPKSAPRAASAMGGGGGRGGQKPPGTAGGTPWGQGPTRNPARATEKLQKLLGIIDPDDWRYILATSPKLRAVLSANPDVQRMAEVLIDLSAFHKLKHQQGVTTGFSVEDNLRHRRAILWRFKRRLPVVYANYLRRLNNLAPDPEERLGRAVGVRMRRAIDPALRRKSLSPHEFFKAIGEEMILERGAKHPIPEVAEVAKLIRKEVYDWALDEMIAVGALPKRLRKALANGYLTRLWRIDQIKKRRVDFEQMLAKHYEANGDAPDVAAEAAVVTTNKILQSPLGRVDWEPEWVKGTRSTRMRLIDIPDADLLKGHWIETDIELQLDYFFRSIVPDIELMRVDKHWADLSGKSAHPEWRPDPALRDVLHDVEHAYDQRIARATGDEKVRLEKYRQSDMDDLRSFVEEMRGTLNQPKDPDAMHIRVMQGLRRWNVLTDIGTFMMSSLPDLARPFMMNGFARTFGAMVVPFVRDWQTVKLNLRDQRAYGIGFEVVGNSRIGSLFDVGDQMGRRTRLERGLRAGSDWAGFFSLLTPWTGGMKQVTAIGVGQMMAEDILRLRSLTGKEFTEIRANLARRGIDTGMAARIEAELLSRPKTQRGFIEINSMGWKDLGAQKAWQMAIQREVDLAIVTPGIGDKPIWVSNEWGRFIGQYKTYAMAATNRVLIMSAQKPDQAFLNGFAFAVTLGMLSVWLKSMHLGFPTPSPDTPEGFAWWVRNGIDRSGVPAILSDINNVFGIATGGAITAGRPFGGVDPAYRYTNRTLLTELAGRSSTKILDINEIMKGLGDMTLGERPSQKFWNAWVRITPGANMIWFRALMQAATRNVQKHSTRTFPKRAPEPPLEEGGLGDADALFSNTPF